ncbi:MAG: hypothetical protein IPI67_00040 [Myxococcales bacterium]|nr:hypothetical protein [Myxococcales bacterium]
MAGRHARAAARAPRSDRAAGGSPAAALVADNYRTLEAAADQNVIAPLPSFVKDEFSGYLDCGVLGRGFGFLQCKNAACRQKLLAALGCIPYCTSCARAVAACREIAPGRAECSTTGR